MKSVSPAPVGDMFRRHGWVVDVTGALLVGVIGAVSKPTITFASAPQAAYSLIVCGCCATMLIRRHRPRLALAVMAVLLAAQLLAVDQLSIFAAVICLIAVYTAQTRLVPPWRWVVLILTYAGATAAIITSSAPALSSDWRQRAILSAALYGLLTIAALTGVVRRNARDRYDLAVERASVLEAQQDTERQLAAVEERTRIAREMHDILGHSLTAVAVQAEGARYALRTDPDRADWALANIGRLSRHAVGEVRDLIDVLRTEDEPADTHPTPSLRDVPTLIGALSPPSDIRLRVSGDSDSDNVPHQISLAAYRIIQESLTNAVKHAGDAPIMIRTTINTDNVEVLIANGAPNRAEHSSRSGQGHGVIGIQERVRALGGTIDIGPDPTTGGWRVAAQLSWRHQ